MAPAQIDTSVMGGLAGGLAGPLHKNPDTGVIIVTYA